MRPLIDNRYRIVGPLGSGGMGEVYLAHDETLGRDVAIKVLARHLTEQPDAVERFDREARSAASLSHSNIVPVHDRGATGASLHYIVMEYVSGGTLRDLLDREGPLPLDKTLSLTLQAARALKVAHERGVIHRDIKPQNMLLTGTGDLKVTDFGIARAASLNTLTETGLILGTAHYISPEQALGEPATPQSDLYSLGIVLYEMLTGELPYVAETPIGIAMKHVNGHLRWPGESDPHIPEEVSVLTVELASREPSRRPPDADALITRLERLRNAAGSAASSGREATVPLIGPVRGGQTAATRTYTPPPTPPAASVGERRARPGYTGVALVTAGLLVILVLAGAGVMAFAGLGPVAGFSGEAEKAPPPSESRRPSAVPPANTSEPTITPGSTPTSSSSDAPTEAAAEEAAGDYYRAAGLEDWDYTYEQLDSQTRSGFTREEWSQKNQWYWDRDQSIYHILSVNLDSASEDLLTEVQLRVTSEDGSSFVRTTYWVFEDGQWRRRFFQEDTDSFMPDLSFEEFVQANGGPADNDPLAIR
ncbi:MAG: protein kinase domain-containing protein [Rubrobacter sp.]